MICDSCGKEVDITLGLEKFGNKEICRECMEEIGGDFDGLEIRSILRRRGKEWILKELEKIKVE